MKIALYSFLLLSAIGGIFSIGYKLGTNNEKVIIQERIIQSTNKDVDIEIRQEKWLHVDGNAHINWLRQGDF